MLKWRMSKESKTQLPECECGCGNRTKGGRFLPGHDAKLKKSLIEAALGGSKRATAKLEELGWTKFLEAKRAKTLKKDPSEPELPRPEPRRRGRPRKNSATTTESGPEKVPCERTVHVNG